VDVHAQRRLLDAGQETFIVPRIGRDFSQRPQSSCSKKFCALVNYLTLWRRKNMRAPRQARRDVEGMQMRAWMVGIAVVVAIGLIWSFAAMSNLVPVDGSEMSLAGISRPAE
jgi:hypothetical protein